MQDPVHALMQSYSRTKAKSYRAFLQTMELHTNSSNNTVYADGDGNIAYFHGNFIPRRDTSFDWTRPVDGSNPATEWHGVLPVDETPHLLNPASGWLYNSNDAPWWAAGASSPRKEDFPAYVQSCGGTARGRHAVRVLRNTRNLNRFQRLADYILPPVNDSGPSIPVPFTSARWGSLASFGARAYPHTKRWYGTYGNSFVAVIEFGDSVRAKAVTAGGESGHPDSPHFNDEAARYAAGNLRDVYFYRSQLKGHTEREYHPGN